MNKETSVQQGFHEANAEQIREVIHDFVPILLKTKQDFGNEIGYLQARVFVDEALVKTKLIEKTSCASATCSFCCHDTIFVSHDEGDYIKRIVSEKGIVPNADRVDKQKRMNPNIKWIDKACPLLLDEDESGQRKCSIYEDRPLICRTHNSTENPEFCDKSKYPKRTVGELKAVMIEGIVMSSMLAGNNKSNLSQDSLVPLHSIL